MSSVPMYVGLSRRAQSGVTIPRPWKTVQHGALKREVELSERKITSPFGSIQSRPGPIPYLPRPVRIGSSQFHADFKR